MKHLFTLLLSFLVLATQAFALDLRCNGEKGAFLEAKWESLDSLNISRTQTEISDGITHVSQSVTLHQVEQDLLVMFAHPGMIYYGGQQDFMTYALPARPPVVGIPFLGFLMRTRYEKAKTWGEGKNLTVEGNAIQIGEEWMIPVRADIPMACVLSNPAS